jgi:hypothetical protein
MNTTSLDNNIEAPLIKQVSETNDNKIEKNTVIETVLELFANIFMKDYYENIKKNK